MIEIVTIVTLSCPRFLPEWVDCYTKPCDLRSSSISAASVLTGSRPSIYSQFRTLSREIAKDIQAYSRVQWEKHIEALSPVDNTLWRKSSFLRKPIQSIPPLKGALGSIAITPIEKAEVIADSLQVQFEPNHVAGRELFDQRIHDKVTNFINTPHVQEIEPTTPTEVLSYVQRLKPRKSPGLDQISNPVRFSTQVLDSSSTAQSNGVDSQWLCQVRGHGYTFSGHSQSLR
ncbi:putative RNA-directed DNA polymerase from transposon X-element [Trichonephila clavipes]|nr:putative RNA-directed DNA polymerase from transposon X-element [Trichonephila clavipes]